MKKSALLVAVLVVASLALVCCGGKKKTSPPSGLTTRIFASQSVSSLTATPGLVIIDGTFDTVARASRISAGTAPGYMEISPERATVMVFDAATNNIDVVSSQKETSSGTIPLPGPTTSMVAVSNTVGYVAVPSAPVIG